MEEEKFISGYCRVLDCSRMVEVILSSGQLDEVDCCYGSSYGMHPIRDGLRPYEGHF